MSEKHSIVRITVATLLLNIAAVTAEAQVCPSTNGWSTVGKKRGESGTEASLTARVGQRCPSYARVSRKSTARLASGLYQLGRQCERRKEYGTAKQCYELALCVAPHTTGNSSRQRIQRLLRSGHDLNQPPTTATGKKAAARLKELTETLKIEPESSIQKESNEDSESPQSSALTAVQTAENHTVSQASFVDRGDPADLFGLNIGSR